MGSKNAKFKPHKVQPAWGVRLSATFLDVGLCACGAGMIHANLLNPISIPLIVAFYYWMCEFFFGRTLGKMILRVKITDKKGNPPTKLRLGMRTLLRLVLSPIMLLSWKRVSLLDLLSGCRVIKIDAEPVAEKGAKLLLKEPVVGWR